MSNAVSSFQHVAPELRLYGGPGSLDALARELDRSGCRRAAVVCGATLAHSDLVMAELRRALGERLCGEFTEVRAHSPVGSIEQAAGFLASTGADAVLALGGGSAIVTARAASIVLAEGRGVAELCTRRAADGRLASPRLAAPKLPQFVLPTTPTTACVKTGSAVLDPASGARMALFDPKTRAKAIFLHPALLQTADAGLVLSASLNTLAMAVEGLESSSSDAVSDALLMHAVRLLAEHLPGLEQDPDNEKRRTQLMLAAVLCGRGTDVAGGGLASVLGHAIGSRVHAANGIVNAIVLPHTMRYNAPATRERIKKVVYALSDLATGLGGAAQADAVVQEVLERLPIPRRLREIGVAREQLPQIALAAMDDWFLDRNPQPVRSDSEILSLLEQAW